MSMEPPLPLKEALLLEAKKAAQFAYAPYSQFKVGAALLTPEGQFITGANVENASYGLTLCAERVALTKAISEGINDFVGIAIWTENTPNGSVTPCGACRQVLAEFCKPHTWVVNTHPDTGAIKLTTLEALLPEAFSL